ncbi:DUF1993 domain-containing protein [Rhizobium tubonense]|uniref:DUF1993 domain-containing protein n=1 Tax=Rhizobium tubonense TaxID=484088 RepID=A0A2W4CEW7_9HYPH|nr:DUF1993 domain-containing protein [Rhizobium tubonense]PZM09718.1 hypothetical protein CPY51_25955 [Rhizobium tubonense]
MSLSMYRLTVPVFQRGLGTMKTYLDKAEAFANEKRVDATTLVSARLAPDMAPLSGQYQRVTDTAKLAVARLTGIDAPRFEDNETTIAQLRERLAKTEAYLATITPEAMDGSGSREVTISPGGNKIVMRGDEYVATFALPNFYFHIATAHAILRNQGLPVGKMDYLGSFS